MNTCKLTIVAIFYLLIISCNSGTGKTSLESENLQGKVKSVKEYWIEITGQNNVSEKKLSTCNFYNPKGYVTEIQEFDKGGILVEKQVFNYNEENLLLSKKALTGNGDHKWRLKYQYNEKDSTVEITLEGSGGETINSTKHRFVDGKILNPIKENSFQSGENYYDTEGNLVEMKMLNNQFVFQYKYSNQLLIETLCHDGENKLISKELYKYDSKNNLTEKRSILASGKLIGLFKYEYIFDDEGNWISKKEIFNHKTISITEREIVYY
jgi:hypothetical protein